MGTCRRKFLIENIEEETVTPYVRLSLCSSPRPSPITASTTKTKPKTARTQLICTNNKYIIHWQNISKTAAGSKGNGKTPVKTHKSHPADDSGPGFQTTAANKILLDHDDYSEEGCFPCFAFNRKKP